VSKSDVFDRLAEREEDLEEGYDDDINSMDELDEEGIGVPSRRYLRSEYWMTRIDSWFEVLKSRVLLYGDKYPFVVFNNEIVLDYDSDEINHKSYIFLLLCSKLYLADKTTSGKISSYFEILSFEALKLFLPTSFEVELFGANELNDNNLFGRNVNLLNKIKNLALVLNENLSAGFKESAYPDNNYGDGGLDLVAFGITGDNQGSNIIILGQCACTVKWKEKQSSSDYSAWSNRIDLTTITINAIFIPFCYRDASGDWFDRGCIRQSFLIDRSRLIYYLNGEDKLSREVSELIDNVVSFKEAVI
jgi:hypothetical protein